jgi:hypothetical protein
VHFATERVHYPALAVKGTGANALTGGIRFAHFSTSTSAVCRQHPVAGRRDGVPPPRGGNRTTLEAPARRRDGHPQDLDSLFAASAGPKWTIGLCAGSAFIAALSPQPTFARFPATARKQGRPFDRLGKRKSPSPESHPVPSGTGSSNPVPSSEESANHRSPPACPKNGVKRDPDAGGVIAGALTSRRNARDHRPLIE